MPSLRDAARSLTRAPGLTAAAVICLALGSAATTAMATLVDVAMLRTLPFPHADRLVRVWLEERDADRHQMLSIPEITEVMSIRAFERFHGTARVRAVVLFGEGAERLRGEAVSDGYFDTLGVRAAHGRLLEADDFKPGAPPAIVLSYGTFMRGFGGDASIVGRTLRSERAQYVIVGVAPREFGGTVEPDVIEFWTPMHYYEPIRVVTDRSTRLGFTLGRLRPDATIATAQAELDTLTASWKAAYPDLYRQLRLHVEPFGESWRSEYRHGVNTIAIAAVVLLAIAGLNVGCLLVARVLDRRRELAVRAAIGADRFRIARLLFLEAAMIVVIGGALGVVAGSWVLEGFLAVSPVALPDYLDLSPDLRTLAASIGALGVAGLLAGSVPAFIGGRVGPSEVLKESGRGNSGGRIERRWVGMLVAAEIALTLTLLVSGGLLIRAYDRLASLDTGYRRGGVARLAVTFSRADAGDAASRHLAFERLRDTVARYPGVERVGLVSPTLPPWDSDRVRVRFNGLDTLHADGLEAGYHLIDEELLPALGMRILAGRGFDSTDRPGGPPVAIVSASLAERMGGVERAIGQDIAFGNPDMPGAETARVVGVASDVAYDGLGEQGTGRYIRYAGGQDPRAARLDLYLPLMRSQAMIVSIAAITSGDPAALIDPLRREINRLAPGSAVHWTGTMEGETSLEYASTRFYALLVGVFSGSALALTSVGLFALLSHTATRRSAEMGLRLALGASPAQVGVLLLRTGLMPLAAGGAAGLAGAAWASSAMRSLIYDVSAGDVLTFSLALTTLALVALAAGLLPARRVASVDPAAIMRE
jgi:putative ABC transport system permease protein